MAWNQLWHPHEYNFAKTYAYLEAWKPPCIKLYQSFFVMLSILILSLLRMLQLLIGCAVWESCVFSTMFYNSSLVTNNSENLIGSRYLVRLSMLECNWSFLYSKFDSFGTVHLLLFFFFFWVFFHEHSQTTGLQGKREGISLTPHYHFSLLQRHLDISHLLLPKIISYTSVKNPWKILLKETNL